MYAFICDWNVANVVDGTFRFIPLNAEPFESIQLFNAVAPLEESNKI